jgi:hypothetical protein
MSTRDLGVHLVLVNTDARQGLLGGSPREVGAFPYRWPSTRLLRCCRLNVVSFDDATVTVASAM